MEKFKTEFKWASIFTSINLVWVYIEKYLGFHDKYIDYHSIVGLVMLIPLIFCIYFSLKQKREAYYKGNITWQKAFLSGALLSLLIAGLSAGPVYVMVEYISPDFFDVIKSKRIDSGMMTDFANELYNLNSYIKNAIFLYLSFGVMISAIVGLIVRRKSKLA